jgi:hypothetical protein
MTHRRSTETPPAQRPANEQPEQDGKQEPAMPKLQFYNDDMLQIRVYLHQKDA